MIFSGFGVFYTTSQTVCIRIGSQYQICIYFFCKFQSQFKSFVCFRIRVTYSREFTIRKFLLFYYIYIFKAQLFQNSSCRDISCTVKRRIYDFQIFCHSFDRIHMDDLALQLFHIGIIHVFADHNIKTCFFCFRFIHSLYIIIICNFLNFSHDTTVMRRCDLSTIFPVYFVTVIFRWVVACCDIDTCNTSQLSYCIRKFRCRTKALKNICLDSVCCQAQCCFLRKFR